MEKKAPGPPGIIVTALVLVPIGWVLICFGALWPEMWVSKNGLISTGAGYWHTCVKIDNAFGGGSHTECKTVEDSGCDDLDQHIDGGKAAGIITIVLSALYLAFIIVDICCRNVLVSWLGGLFGCLAFIFAVLTWIIGAAIWNEEFCNSVAFKDRPGYHLGVSFYDAFFGSVLLGVGILMHWINRSFCEHDQCCNECCPCTCCCPHCFQPDEMDMAEREPAGGEGENEPTKNES